MAFGLFRRKKGKEEEFVTTIPLQDVIALKAQGLTNEQIINQLRAQGYSFAQIRDALAQAEIKGAVVRKPEAALPTPPETITPAPIPTPGIPTPMPVTPPGAPTPPEKERDIETIERILEEIIEEKWRDVDEKLKEIEKWKEVVESRVNETSNRLNEIVSRLGMIEQTIASKVSEYGKSMQEVASQMAAMEKIMTKLIPSLADSIKELREVIESSKKGIA